MKSKSLFFFTFLLLLPFSIYSQSWNQIIKNVASDRAVANYFGISVSISGNYAVVGAYHNSTDAAGANSLFQAGAAYIFKKDPGNPDNWYQVKKIVASDRTVNDAFGCSVSISGDYVIVGAYSNSTDAAGANSLAAAGAAYIFKQNQGGADNWGQVKKIVASDRTASNSFGSSVSISGDYVIVGAPYNATDASGAHSLNVAGSAYIFKQSQGGVDNWGQVKKIVALDRAVLSYFGYSISISGNYAIVGAIGNATDATGANSLFDAGAAYIFKQSQGGVDNWGQVKKIVASDRTANNKFGFSISISDNYAIVSAYGNSTDAAGANSLNNAGAAYIFKQSQGGADNWGEVKKLVASDRSANDWFGTSASISGDDVIVGAQYNTTDVDGANSLGIAGAAYIFKQNQGGADNWGQVKKIVASDRTASNYFGYSISISGNYAIVGAFGNATNASGTNSLASAGASYMFKTLPPPTVTTNAASSVETTTVTLNGTVNANGSSTTVTFEYGTTVAYGTSVTAAESPVTGSSNTSVSKAISGLTANTTYHYRVVGVNAGGTTNGTDQTFTTNPLVPVSIAATNKTNVSFRANWNAVTGAAGYRLDVATDAAFTNFATGFENRDVTNVTACSVGGLTAGSIYFYRVRAYFSNITSANSNIICIAQQPTNIQFSTVNNTSYNVSYTASTSGGSYLVVRGNGTEPVFTPLDGVNYSIGAQGVDNIVYVGSNLSFLENNVATNFAYYYKVYNFHQSGGTSYYVTDSPLVGFNKILPTGNPISIIPATTSTASSAFPAAGVTITFPEGTAGTTLTVTKENGTAASSSNFKGEGNFYFTIHSTNTAPGSYTLILDFSPMGLPDYSAFRVFKRADEYSDWNDITVSPFSAVITNRATDGVPGKFTITGLSSFSQFSLGQSVNGVSTNIDVTAPASGSRLKGGTTTTINWRKSGSMSAVKMEYTTDGGSTWKQILPDGKDQPLVGLLSYPWVVPSGINSNKCAVKVSGWSRPNIYSISDEFTIWDISLVTPSANQTLYSGTSKEITWKGEVPGGVNVKFSSDGGYNWYKVGETSEKSVNKVDWIVPDVTAEYCQVKIQSNMDSQISVMNVNPFAIDRMLGDVTGNGNVELVDAAQVLKKIVGLIELNTRETKSADVDADNTVGMKDAFGIMYKIANGEYPRTSELKKINSPLVTINNEGKAPGVISIPINIKNSTGIRSVEVELLFDNNEVTLENVKSKLPEGWVFDKSFVNGELKIAAAGLTELSEGNILSLEFKLKDRFVKTPMDGTIKLNGEISNKINTKLQELPSEYLLSQNYPNPFNPETTISYSLAKDSNVKILIYNILGEIVANIDEKIESAGNYKFIWNAANYASGIYFYQINAIPVDGEKAFTKSLKMMLVK